MESILEAVALSPLTARAWPKATTGPDTDLDAPVSKPQIVIRRPRSATGRDVTDALARASSELQPLLLPCYPEALEARPSLRGTLVLGIKVGPDGSIRIAHGTELAGRRIPRCLCGAKSARPG